ncbi:ribosomal protection-like ABC-F family protein [Alkalihalobacterium bogoriense]|uniref:ribosomal protection-like ABC-F family protein n=1 Tax=Alkalihalobacterium bogoriense TaxID=246272 RepID=UPI00047EFA2D|nr:ABC-F type ribosomal protection protein [Alkalihalobacterium bogoriense]
MKELLRLQNISVEINDFVLFEKVTANVQQGDRIGIIGKNGAGKTTLLQLLHNELTPTNGEIKFVQTDLMITMVEQETETYTFNDMTPQEEKLLDKWAVPNHDFSSLSGGEKLKARLAKGFAHDTDLFLLDEPTNHLDEQSVETLAKYMKDFKGTIVFVSHDRYFLDLVATKIWSLENQTLFSHKGNYSSYIEARTERRQTQQREYEKQQKRIDQIEGQIKELTSWSTKAHAQSTKQEGFKEYYRAKAKRMDTQVKSKQRRLENELNKAKIERPEDEYTVTFAMNAKQKLGKRFLEVKQLRKSVNDRLLFQDASFTIGHGEKVAIIGPNGSGKTTLLNIITGVDVVDDGVIWISPSANIGYLTQEVFDLPLEQTPAHLFYQETFAARGHVQNIMRHLGFSSTQWTEPISHMSMGERVKCKLMKFILEEKDVLILDEPTNHLDLASREQLEDTLSQYQGTLLVVSHDRYFIEKTTTTNLVIANESIQKKLQESSPQQDETEQLRLQLETERQEVLGRLSFLTPDHKDYSQLDLRFNELTKQIKQL